MNDRVAPERMNKNQFALGKNLETRYGGVRSRRGSWRVDGALTDDAGTDATVTGSGIHKFPEVGQSDLILTATYLPDSDTTRIYRTSFPVRSFRSAIETPYTIEGKQPVRFVQAYGYTYAFPVGGEPMRWSGVDGENFEYVPNGVSGAMPQARDGVYAYNRLWLIEGDDTIIASDLLSANWDRINNEFRVEQGDGTRLIALRPFSNGNLIAFKERGIAVISGANNFTTTSDMAMQFIDDRIGCIAPDTAVAIGKDVFFLGREGVWTIQQTSEQNAQLVELPLSEPIWGLIQDINWQYAENFSAAHHDNYYVLAVSVDGSEYPNRLLVYDLLSRSWVGYWELGSAPNTFQRVGVVDHLRKQFLLGLEENGATNALLNGDTEDFVGGAVDFMLGDAAVYFDSTVSLSEHTSGFVEARIQSTSATTAKIFSTGGGVIWQVKRVTGYGGGSWGAYWQVTFQTAGTGGEISADFPEVPAGSLTETNPNWMTVKVQEIGGDLYASINEFGPKLMSGVSYDGTWLSGVSSIRVNSDNCRTDYVRIYTDVAVSSDPWMIYWPFNVLSSTTTTRYEVESDGSVTETTETANGNAFNSTSESDEDVVSELKTRGYMHGGELVQKNGYRGELRFEHGQPSVTAVMSSDKPFDTETLASLNAKTYSLTAYDIHNKAAWVQDNSNDDFATPFREDYAPIALNGAGSGVDIGTNGLDLDVYAEHTELFTSLAIAGWVQFTLTNTQGYVRYNNLQIEANNRSLQQDGGNQ